jgi:hypothetical protein
MRATGDDHASSLFDWFFGCVDDVLIRFDLLQVVKNVGQSELELTPSISMYCMSLYVVHKFYQFRQLKIFLGFVEFDDIDLIEGIGVCWIKNEMKFVKARSAPYLKLVSETW